MSRKPHENIRINVVNLLTQAFRRVVENRCRVIESMECYVLRRLLEKPEGITILMPQEVYVEKERLAVDTLLGDVAVIEYKGGEGEFKIAEGSARGKYKGIIMKKKYYIATTWDKWRIYKIERDDIHLIFDGDQKNAEDILVTQILPEIKELKIPPLPENIEALYKLDHEKFLEDLKKAFRIVKDDSKIKPLYEAYKSIIKYIYGEASEDFFEDLFLRHTFMQIAVIASLTAALGKTGSVEDVCSGSLIGVEVALPYLNWWKLALFDKNTQTLIENVLKEIVGRANLVNWSYETAEDAFRMLYEFLVEPKVRRQLGEYYTPIWLVEMIIKEFDLTKKVVLDPFCGSGTFLIKSFHEKVEKGESPDEALNEVVGFDINPLAVSVARAELLLAYRRVSGKEPVEPPYIYHADTLGTWFGKYVFPAMGLYELAKKASAYMDTLINLKQINIGDASNILATLKKLEKNLTYAIRFAHNECRLEEKCLEEKIARYLEQGLGGSTDSFAARFLEHFKTENVAGVIAKLLVTHGGNDVWAVVFMSIYAPILMTGFKASIIVTNPPWIPVYEYKAPYSEKIRNYMKDGIMSCIGDKAAQVLAGADIASASLVKSIEYASDGVGYIMNREQLFNHSSSVPGGIIATYCLLEKALKNSNSKVKLYDFDFDVFQHGMPPAVVIVKKG